MTVNVEELIERLRSINEDVIGLETAYEYGGNWWTCPSPHISKLIRELEAMTD